MIRIVVVLALGAALWRKVSRKRRYALGVVTTALLSMGGAVLGGLLGDLLVDGSGVARDAAAGLGAVGGAILFVLAGELGARHRKGWPLFGPAPEKPKRTLRRR
ncbi:hypothetical protein [Sporichthya polymorpha]|uniref:hypothetical protein n=1 Tax=Sporichthya polymorpha TaxID=35751 RepID=UPI000373FE88|nr:hypothetical protein [Sporichthya polymorpha]